MSWQKSSYSYRTNCVEALWRDGKILLRDSKNPGAHLAFTPIEWQKLLDRIKKGATGAAKTPHK